MSTVMVAPEHLLFESWPTAVVVLAGSRVVFANSAAAILHVRSREELLSIDLSRAIPEWVVPAETAHLQDLDLARQAGRIEPGTFSVTLTAGDGSRKALQVRVAAGPRPGESTLLLLEVTEDVRELTDALAAASWSLVSKRDERAVLDAAADALSTLGFRVVILRDEGAYFRHVAIRQEHGAVARVETITGGSLAERPLPRAEAREFAECIEKRTAIFIQDAHALVDRFRAPDVARAIKASMPRRSVVAPVVVDGEGWGVLTAQRDSLVVGRLAVDHRQILDRRERHAALADGAKQDEPKLLPGFGIVGAGKGGRPSGQERVDVVPISRGVDRLVVGDRHLSRRSVG